MATPDWRTGEPLADRLLRRPASFDFFQWVRLQSWPRRGTPARRDGARYVSPRLRFRGEMSPVFPGSEISKGRLREERSMALDDPRLELFVANFALSGVLGPMPDSFADWARQRLAERDPAMAQFLDIFNHRLSTLRYELKAASVPAFDAVRPEDTRQADAAGALMGLSAFEGEGAAILARRVPVPRRALLALAGLVANGRKSAAQAQIVLGVYLQAPVQVQALVGAWRDIEARDRTLLGRRVLGDGAPLGQRVWVNHAAIGLRIGPVPYARLCLLLPDRAHLPGGAHDAQFGNGYRGLAAMVHYLFDRHVDAVVTIEVDEADIPASWMGKPRRLAGFGSGHGLRLGQTAWVSGRPEAKREVTFTIRADDVQEAA
ncbi:type VI secretion system baseplate subunit TssG [Dyella sp. LX-66]|uniref:type VI secretion system baseplate subunit TssG n=1 Tax=unclassified Dyella TaxID=2634549 RepID=UPI001BE032CE|nr:MULTISPECIES: type VI secretion system baseplate subunit TssG [unclassified Dyella]MBT2118354.1 type VI secretion system baseplate subunit TssG [Dyella sp. LX-1]MBT2140237.1 type VI secretion system baseplate subunit TssG [Dyella sp. LX-66]